jgi:hypothetical protein
MDRIISLGASRRTIGHLSAPLRCAGIFLFMLAAMPSWAQSPKVLWAVSSYGPGSVEAGLGCGGCSSDKRSMAVDASGNVIVSGFVTSDPATTGTGWKTTKFNGATGAVMWESIFNTVGNGADQAYAMTLDPTGNALVTGYQWNGTNGDIKTIKYAAATGAVVWEASVPGTPGGNDFGIVVATDASGNAFVGGSTWNGTNDDMRTVKYAAATGAVIWDKTFAGPGNGPDYVFALAVDAGGNVIVTGESQTGATANPDWKTIKYAAADGAILWQAVFAGTAAGLDIPTSVVIDTAGNAIVAGYTFNGTNSDMKIIKYASANGAVLWQNGFAGTGNGDDQIYDIALDSAGNAIATGYSFNGTSNDWKTIKFAAASGAILWEKSFAGTGNGSDISVVVTIDASGNAIVGGRKANTADRDMKVVSYAANTGATIWQYDYAGTTVGGFDRAAALAIGPGVVFVAGESTETGKPLGWRIVKLENLVVVPTAVRGDISGDGKADLLLRDINGVLSARLMNGTAVTGSTTLLAAGPAWSVTHTGDLNGDGKTDLIFRHTDGSVVAYLMNGLTLQSSATLLGAGSPWVVTHVADFNGDGKADILWRNTTDGSVAIWLMDGTTLLGGAGILGASPWVVTHVADFNGDGKADILWRNSTDGTVATWLMNGSTLISGAAILGASSWVVTHVADFNGDGKADILWRNSTDGTVATWLMNGTTLVSGASILGASTWVVTQAGDLDGDGKADLLWRNSADGTVAAWLMNGSTFVSGASLLGAASGWTIQKLLDFNGDGKADLVWRHTDGTIAVWLMNGLTLTSGAGITGAGSNQVVPAP